ncbi:MAG: 6-oxocyclohex-1-ene-1-carbonyl-CoA hydratase [Planctomycetota bacterium]|nr:6-oxocyclohex-1-ene-1-carbonyl-CoA hydratase [Planctomycetota bacterium]
MSLEWLPRDNAPKDHSISYQGVWGTEPPCTVFEKTPLLNAVGKPVEGLSVARITLNNPAQYNSYTTQMVKGVIAALQSASVDRSVTAVVLTGAGHQAFCTGGNTKEYAEYYAGRPEEYGAYMDLFNSMVDGILNCKKPVICRVNGMRVAGGQEIGMACDLAVSSDLAVFGQAGPRHGSAPVGGASDFLPWFLTMEDAMWNCISCELWSAYRMKQKGLISRVVPVLKKDGRSVPNPEVTTDTWLRDGQIVYGEFKQGKELEEAKALKKSCQVDLVQLDAEVNRIIWHLSNLFPGCLQTSIDSVRAKKRLFWDQAKAASRQWLMTNMMGEAFLGFTAFNTRKLTGRDTIDFIKYRQLIAAGRMLDQEFFEQVLPSPTR